MTMEHVTEVLYNCVTVMSDAFVEHQSHSVSQVDSRRSIERTGLEVEGKKGKAIPVTGRGGP
jgi:hypothetical protein